MRNRKSNGFLTRGDGCNCSMRLLLVLGLALLPLINACSPGELEVFFEDVKKYYLSKGLGIPMNQEESAAPIHTEQKEGASSDHQTFSELIRMTLEGREGTTEPTDPVSQ